MSSLEKNIQFEKRGWTGKLAVSSGPRYILDTVLYHEEETNALYKARRGLELAKGKVLSVGCNCGGFSFLFCKVANEVVGVDILPEPIQWARKFKEWINAGDFSKEKWGEDWCHPPDWKAENVSFVQGNAYNLQEIFDPEVFDTVFMLDCIEHFPQEYRGKAVQEAARVLKKGGLLILSTLLDVDSASREQWMDHILHEVHPFGLSSPSLLEGYLNLAGLSILEKNIDWFGKEHKIQMVFYVAKK